MENKKYFYGQEISSYGMENNRVDFRALAKSFDGVLCNDITALFYGTINGEYIEPEQVNGFIDNSEEIEELQERIKELEERITESSTPEEDENTQEEIEDLQERIEELEEEQNNPGEIFQYYIISDSGAEILKAHTNEIVYYLPVLDVYVWGVTHYGTGWDYVLTDIKIDEEEN